MSAPCALLLKQWAASWTSLHVFPTIPRCASINLRSLARQHPPTTAPLIVTIFVRRLALARASELRRGAPRRQAGVPHPALMLLRLSQARTAGALAGVVL